MKFSKNSEYIYRQELWEEYQEYRAELEDETILTQLNKLHNRKGYTLSDYQNSYDEFNW